MSHNINYWANVSPSYLQGMDMQRQPQQQQMMSQHFQQQSGQHHLFNPNANTFVPRQQQQPNYGGGMPQQQSMYGQPNSYAYQQPGYASPAQMYGGNVQQPQPPQQQQQQQFGYNDYAPAMTAFYQGDDLGFDQYGFAQQQQYVATDDLREQHQKSENYKEIQEILVGLEQLLPGGEDFNSWALAIKDRMSSKHMSIEAKKLAIQTACEMATMVTPPPMPFTSHTDYQAQYTMARLVAFLANEVPDLMTAAILPVLEQTHNNRPKTGTFQQKANLLMFFSDLYTRLETELQIQEVAGKKLPPLADAVIVQMKDFLHSSNVSDESMKLLLQVLKLAGRDLDSVPAVYDDLCQLLSTLMGHANGHPKLSETIKAQIKDLIDQRSKGWGPVVTKTSPSVYCADGSILELNDDESKFLEECLEGESSSQFSMNDPSDTSLDEVDVMNEFDSFMKEEALMERTMSMINDLSVREDDDEHSTTPQPPVTVEEEATKSSS